jgi:hypothetical protein
MDPNYPEKEKSNAQMYQPTSCGRGTMAGKLQIDPDIFRPLCSS